MTTAKQPQTIKDLLVDAARVARAQPVTEDVEMEIVLEGDAAVVEMLSRVLGSTFCLYLKTQASHWNVEGPTFPQLHDLFGDHYRNMWEAVDDLAERIRMLDAYAPDNISRLMDLSVVECWKGGQPLGPEAMLLTLAGDHERMGLLLSEAFHVAEQTDKQGIADYLAGRITEHSKMRWFLVATAKRVA